MSKSDNTSKNRTCIILQRVIMELLDRHSFQKITVNDICRTAIISRAAFYTHYDDKYHLLRCALENSKSNFFGAGTDTFNEKELLSILKNIHTHGNVFKNMLLDDANHELFAMLARLFTDAIADCLKRDDKEYSMPIELLSVYAAGGCTYMLLWWIKNNYSLPEEELAHRLTELISRSLR